MTTPTYDRFSGTNALPNKTGTLLGRWLIDQDIELNSIEARMGEFVVPDTDHYWSILAKDGVKIKGFYYPEQLPDETMSEIIRSIGQVIDDQISKTSSWIDWVDISPLVSDELRLRFVEIHEVEKAIDEYYGHLKHVCYKPRTTINSEVERMPVSRARRVAREAANYLAGHTEDWHRKTLTLVEPKRVLTELRIEEVDIYENRVVVNLVDKLIEYLNRRIRDTERALGLYRGYSKFSDYDEEDEETGYSKKLMGTYLRNKRICELWGESIDNKQMQMKAEATLRELIRLKYRVLELKDSPLYRNMPDKVYVQNTLRNTNIFTNEQNYNRVARLWHIWARYSEEPTSPRSMYKEYQDLCRSFDNYAMLLIVRALEQLNIKPHENATKPAIDRGGRVPLEFAIPVNLKWEEDGTISLEMQGKVALRVLPLVSSLNAPVLKKAFYGIAKDMSTTYEKYGGNPALIIYPDASHANSPAIDLNMARMVYTAGNDPRSDNPRGLGMLPVSPWDIESVERVARAIKWIVYSTYYDKYPPTIPAPPEGLIDLSTANRWISKTIDDEIQILCPPTFSEESKLDISTVGKNTRARCMDKEKGLESIEDELRKKRGDRREKAQLNAQKKIIRQEFLDAKDSIEGFSEFETAFNEAVGFLRDLLICPVCGTEGKVRDFEALDKGCFRCICPDCGAFWGKYICEKGHQYPVLLPGTINPTEDYEVGWEDRQFGSDILALPAGRDNSIDEFICPICEYQREDKILNA